MYQRVRRDRTDRTIVLYQMLRVEGQNDNMAKTRFNYSHFMDFEWFGEGPIITPSPFRPATQERFFGAKLARYYIRGGEGEERGSRWTPRPMVPRCAGTIGKPSGNMVWTWEGPTCEMQGGPRGGQDTTPHVPTGSWANVSNVMGIRF